MAGDAESGAERWPLQVGVLGLQGAFAEHVHVLERRFAGRVVPRIVRSRADLTPPLDALILPGGESTSMSIMAERFGLLEDLRHWVASGRPIMGTCAGLILLSDKVVGAQEGQQFIGGLQCRVHRNFYGAQTESFVAPLELVGEASQQQSLGIFIRAPLIETFDASRVQVLATLGGRAVAIQQDNILALTFHPELTDSPQWHDYFIQMVQRHVIAAQATHNK